MLVGAEPKQQRFTVHHDIITRRSGFFRAARSERWTTDKSKPANMQQYDPEIFASYLHCIYRDVVPRPNKWTPEADAQRAMNATNHDTDSGNEYYRYLVKLYIIADSLRDPTTANLVIDETRRFSYVACLPGFPVVKLAFRHTMPGDGLRKVLADVYVFKGSSISGEHCPLAFLMLVIGRSMATRKKNEAVSAAIEAVAQSSLYAIGDKVPLGIDGKHRSISEYQRKTGDDQQTEEVDGDGEDDDEDEDPE